MTEEFEKRTRALLEESVTRLDGRVRSRLTQARHAALAEATRRNRGFGWAAWRSWAPAGAVAAAAILAVLLWTGRTAGPVPAAPGAPAAFEDLDLIADGETFELLEAADQDFYEWAAAEVES